MEQLENMLKYLAGGSEKDDLLWFWCNTRLPPHTHTHTTSSPQHATAPLLLSISCAKCLINPRLCKGGFLLLNVNLQVNLVSFYYVTEAAEELWSMQKSPPETAQIAAPALLIGGPAVIKRAPDFYIRRFNTRLEQRNCQPAWLRLFCV